MYNEKNETFNYTYSAKEQEEIKAIRKKYVVLEDDEDKMARVRRLDTAVTQKATAFSLIIGVVGALILGFGMSIAMTELGSIFGSKTFSIIFATIIGLIGIVLVSFAYPTYNCITKKEREKIAPEIIRLTDELIK